MTRMVVVGLGVVWLVVVWLAVVVAVAAVGKQIRSLIQIQKTDMEDSEIDENVGGAVVEGAATARRDAAEVAALWRVGKRQRL